MSGDFSSYAKNTPAEKDSPKPTRQRPLVLNMVGELNKRNSLVMTYDDFYDYLKSVFDGKSMGDKLKEDILEADYFIFIGLSFDKWYTHLFMRILDHYNSQQHRKRSSKKFAANRFLNDMVATHCVEQYTMTFVPNGIEAFVDRLHQKCQERGLLRTAATKLRLDLDFKLMKELVAANEFPKVFMQLKSALYNLGAIAKEDFDKVILLEAQYNELQSENLKGKLSFDEATRKLAVIRDELLKFISMLEKKYGAG